jgi:hypothetical protein
MNLKTAHNEWASRPADQRFTSLDELELAVSNRRNLSKTIEVDVKQLTVKEVASRDGNGTTLAFNGIMVATEPTHWSLGQVATAAKLPCSYIRSIPTDLAVLNINHGIANRADSGPVKLLTLSDTDGGMNRLMAMTSTRYGRIWDADCVNAVKRINEQAGGRFFNPKAYPHTGQPKGFGSIDSTSAPVPSGLYASDHDVFMFMIDGGSRLEVGERAKLNRGFIVWNSEVGAKTLGITTFLFNEVCGNHIIWGAQDVNTMLVRHSSGAPARFDREAMPHLLDYINASAAPVEAALKKAAEIKLLDLLPAAALVTDVSSDEFVKSFAGKFAKFSRGEIRDAVIYAKAEEGKCETLWDMVQGLTASAREYEWIDARMNLEQRAGSLLNIADALAN